MCFLLAISPSLFARPGITELLTDDLFLTEKTLLFVPEKGVSSSIARARIHFLESHDCQSGYAGVYDTFHQDTHFSITIGKPFGLRADAVYQAALASFDEAHIAKLHSILIRFLSNKGQFAWFTGQCSDQDVNCCVPVICSNQTGTCLAEHDDNPPQPFVL